MLNPAKAGQVIGRLETIGYCLTAVFTVLVVRAVTRPSAPRWMAYLGYVAAALIATGVVIPLGLDIARPVNLAGCVSWCSWLVAMAIVLWRGKPHADGSTASPAGTRSWRRRSPLSLCARRAGLHRALAAIQT